MTLVPSRDSVALRRKFVFVNNKERTKKYLQTGASQRPGAPQSSLSVLKLRSFTSFVERDAREHAFDASVIRLIS